MSQMFRHFGLYSIFVGDMPLFLIYTIFVHDTGQEETYK
jgi:hypothetical protein